jgi:hypothetical protein
MVLATGQGEIFGTPAYMAPEQVSARADDPRIDIYAFGCIAFELVTGTPPFVGRPLEIMSLHLSAPPPRPSEVAPQVGVPRRLDEIILRCLQKAPPSRFQTGAELGLALNELRMGTAALAATQQLRRRAGTFGGELTMPEPGGGWGGGGTVVEDTSGGSDVIAGDELGLPTTEEMSKGEIRMVVDQLLLQLAEAIIDLGCSDFQLAISAANITGARGQLDMLVTRSEELERARDAVSQRARESEARFRFALSELRFEVDQARSQGTVDPDMEYQLDRLEDRMTELASHAERELTAIDDQAIELASQRAGQEEAMTLLFASLETLLDDAIPRFRGHPIIEEILGRLERMRIALT